MKRSISALLCAACLCTSAWISPFSALAEEPTEEETTPVVEMPWSKALYYDVTDENGNVTKKPLPESQIMGEISVIIHDNPVMVTISHQSAEGPVIYYQDELKPQEGSAVTDYRYALSYSECPQDPSQFETVYQADFLNNIYSSAYTITISALDTKGTVYTEEGILIADPHAEDTISGKTQYVYDLTFSDDEENPVQAEAGDAQFTPAGGVVLNRRVQMLWKSYSLGDIDNNGNIDISDAYQILNYYATIFAGGTLPEGSNEKAADVDADGTISINDAFLTLKYYSVRFAGRDITFTDFLKEELPQ